MAPSSRTSPRRNTAPLRLLLWLLVCVGVGVGVRSASQRWNRERENRRVEIAVDFAELRSLAASQGVPIESVLRKFKAAGATSVAAQEETIAGLEEAKLVTVAPVNGSKRGTRLVFPVDAGALGASPVATRVALAIEHKTRWGASLLTPDPTPTSMSLAIPQPWTVVRSLGIGLDPDTIALARGAGLGIVGRVSNWGGVTPDGLVWVLGELKTQGASTVLFSGDELLGYKGYLIPDGKTPGPPTTADVLRNLDLYYGAIEFGKQKGDPELARAAPDRVVRVHTIPGSEMATATIPASVQRFSLAARERNIRLLFVRLFLDEPDPITVNTEYVGKIARELERGNLETGIAHGYDTLGVGRLSRLLMGLAIGAGLVLLADAVTGCLAGGIGVGGGTLVWLCAGAVVALAALASGIGVKLAALAAFLVFSSLGMLASDLLDKDTPFKAWGRFLFASVVTAFGAVLVVGLLADRVFLVKADAFIGIKASLAVPVLLAALVYVLDLRARPDRPFIQACRDAGARLGRLAAQPLMIWQVLAVTVALGLVYVILSRSGNDGAVGVSGAELKTRGFLDRVLFVRPRFKDMFGHAAMIISLLFFARTRRRDWALPLFLVGAFGQVSLSNTFCHLHTPLSVSLWRAGLGLGIGLLGGALIYAVLERMFSRKVPPASKPLARTGAGGDAA